jgi:glycosyltransferase involved in cell wall biosynthesis
MPAYNESKTIRKVIEEAQKYADEVIVYDDGSVDHTNDVVKAAGATVIRHPYNRGYGAAIKRIFRIAREKNADVIVTLDSDGQHDPASIPLLVEPILKQESDIVIGSRFLADDHKRKVPRYRSFGIKTITKFTKTACLYNITDAQSGFRAYSKNAVSKINLFEDGMAVSTEILLRARENDLKITEVPVSINYEVEKSSRHNPLTHGIGVLYSVIHFISLRHPLLCYGLAGIVLLTIASFYTHDALQLFSEKRYISTNMILISVGISVVGVVLLITGVILYSIKALLKWRIRDTY